MLQCPKCGKENPDEAQICNSCGYDLTLGPTGEPTPKSKISKMAIGSAGLAGLAGVLTFFLNPTFAFLTALLGVITAITSIVKIRKSKGKLIGKRLAVAAVIFSTVHIVLLSYWRIDAAAIPNDYTIADIKSAAPEYNESYELLNSLADEDDDSLSVPAIGLSERDAKILEELYEVFKETDYSKISAGLIANAESTLRIWQKAKKGRDVITELSTFPEIADLMEPNMNAELLFLKNLRRIVQLHRAYICLQNCQGNEQVAIDELVKLNSVFKKLSLHSRSLVTKLICIGGLANGIMTANFIANNSQTSHESLVLLAENFTPPAKEHTSLRNSIIFEYLICKNELSKISKEHRLKYTSFSPLKLNSTLRLYKNFCDRWIAVEENQAQIEQLTVWPALYPELPVTIDSDGDYPLYYKVYNPIGSLLVGILMPALDKVFEMKTKLQIHSDLLQIVLNKRLGKEISLKARAYSDEYIIDVDNKKIFSPGPDGKPNTEDDIKLTINPEALGLLSK